MNGKKAGFQCKFLVVVVGGGKNQTNKPLLNSGYFSNAFV